MIVVPRDGLAWSFCVYIGFELILLLKMFQRYTHTHTHARTHARTHTHAHTHTHTHTHTCARFRDGGDPQPVHPTRGGHGVNS